MIQEVEQTKVTQLVEEVEPQSEKPANDSKSFNLSFSLCILAREGLRMSGDLAMQTQQRTMHPVPPRATRSAHPIETQDREQTAQTETQEYPVKQLPGYHQPCGVHWSLLGGTTMLVTLVVLIIASAYIVPFCVQTWQQWHYGDAHISQYDATINGRHDHFIAETLHDRVIVIDLRNSDASKAQVFVSPQRATIEQAIVTLQKMFIDGHEAIVVQVEGQPIASILYSTGNTFTWDIPPAKKG